MSPSQTGLCLHELSSCCSPVPPFQVVLLVIPSQSTGWASTSMKGFSSAHSRSPICHFPDAKLRHQRRLCFAWDETAAHLPCGCFEGSAETLRTFFHPTINHFIIRLQEATSRALIKGRQRRTSNSQGVLQVTFLKP